ncbi:MAG: hypothetical protein KGS72_25915 [Cyanobacteria bacterium REEB67]|nr:hypothetical protein [Cyanobacteria bacterium REEB67]
MTESIKSSQCVVSVRVLALKDAADEYNKKRAGRELQGRTFDGMPCGWNFPAR